MSASRKILLVAAVVVVAAVVAAVVALPMLIDVNAYRGVIEERAEVVLGREVRLGEMNLSVIPFGVRVADVAVAALPEEGGGDLLTASSLRVGARLMPLLRKRLEITGITVERPSMVLARDADGRWNVQRLLTAEAPAPSGPADDGPDASALEGFAVDSIRLTGGRITYRDAALVPGRTFEVVLEDLDARVTDLAVDREIGIELSTGLDALPGASLGFEGRVGPLEPPPDRPLRVSGALRLRDIDPGALAALLHAAGVLAGVPDDFLGDEPFDLSGTVEAARSGDDAASRTAIDTLELDFAGTRLALRGTIAERGTARDLDLELLPSEIRARHLASLLALFADDVPVSFRSSSPVAIRATVRGELSETSLPEVAGTATLEDFTFAHPALRTPVEQVRATVAIGRDRVDLTDFHAVVGSSDASGELHVVGFERPAVTFGLRSRRADFFELFSFLEGEGDTASEDAPADPAAEEMARALTVDGNLEIAEGSFDTLDFTDLSARMTWKDGELRLEPCSMNLYEGEFSGRLTARPLDDPPRFELYGRAGRVALGEALADNLDLGELGGAGAGADMDSVIRALDGRGTVQIDAGRVGRLDVLGALTEVTGLFGEQTLNRLSRQLETEGTAFTRMTGQARIEGGLMRLSDLVLETPEFDLRGSGVVDLLAGTLDSDLRIVFSEEISRAMRAEGSRAGELFFDPKSGRVDFPFTLSGPYDAPSPGIDFKSTLSTVAERVGKTELREALGERLGLDAGEAEGILPGAAPGGSGPALPDTPVTSSPGPGGIRASITRLRWDEGLLERSLRIGGTVEGAGLDHASVIVSDASGAELKRVDRLKEVERWLKRADDPASAAEISWKLDVDAARVEAAALPVTVTLRVVHASGESVEAEVSIE